MGLYYIQDGNIMRQVSHYYQCRVKKFMAASDHLQIEHLPVFPKQLGGRYFELFMKYENMLFV